MTAPAWRHRRAPRAPLDVGMMLAAGGLIESPFRWCDPAPAPRRTDWTAYAVALAVAAGCAAGARYMGVW